MNERADEILSQKDKLRRRDITCLAILRATVHCFADKPFLLKRMIISTLSIVDGQNESRQIDVSVIVVTIISTIFAFYIKQQSDEIDIFNHIIYIYKVSVKWDRSQSWEHGRRQREQKCLLPFYNFRNS